MNYETFEPLLNELNSAYQTIGILKSDIDAAKNNITLAQKNCDLFADVPRLERIIEQKTEMIKFKEEHIRTVVKQLGEVV